MPKLGPIPVVAEHHIQDRGQPADVARQLIHSRDTTTQEIIGLIDTAEQQLEALRASERRNVFTSFRQSRALNNWLEREGYASADEAEKYLALGRQRALQNSATAAENLRSVWLPEVRQRFTTYEQDDKDRADSLFRHFGMPEALVAACDEQAVQTGRTANLMDWLSVQPTADQPFGATDAELEKVLLWNADCTERLASRPEIVLGMINNFLSHIPERVQAGQLDESWLGVTPHITKVLIGNILEERFLGAGGGATTSGTYKRSTGYLMIWPYELPGEFEVRETVDHETVHAFGGFESAWADEGFAEMFTAIIEGEDPYRENGVYEVNRGGIESLLDAVGVTHAQISGCFIGMDHAANEARARAVVFEAYDGNDAWGAVNDAFYEVSGGKPNPRDKAERADAFEAAAAVGVIIGGTFKWARKDVAPVLAMLRGQESQAPGENWRIAYKHAIRFYETMAARVSGPAPADQSRQ